MRLFTIVAILFGASLMFVSSPATAYFRTGNELYSDCKSSTSDAVYYQKNASCMAFISGVIDTMQLHSDWDKGFKICIPEGVTARQVKDMVVMYLEAKPSERHYPAAQSVLIPIAASFPCDKEASK